MKITVESYERFFDASKGMRIVTDLLHPVLSKQTIEIMDTAMMIIMEEDMNKQVVVTMEGMSRVDPEAVTEKHIGHAATTEETTRSRYPDDRKDKGQWSRYSDEREWQCMEVRNGHIDSRRGRKHSPDLRARGFCVALILMSTIISVAS